MLYKTLIGASVLALAVGVSLLGTDAAHAGDKDLWLHVAVDGEGERVRVNVPISLVETALPLVEDEDYTCYTPSGGTRCEKTWENDTQVA